MRQIRPVLVASIALTVAAAGLWGLVVASLGGRADRDSNALLGVAITVSAFAIACWAVDRARRASERRWAAMDEVVRQDRALLIRTLGAVSARKAGPPTAPIRGR